MVVSQALSELEQAAEDAAEAVSNLSGSVGVAKMALINLHEAKDRASEGGTRTDDIDHTVACHFRGDCQDDRWLTALMVALAGTCHACRTTLVDPLGIHCEDCPPPEDHPKFGCGCPR